MTHHNSVTVGVTLGHWLTGRLALESGLHWLQSGASGTVVVPGADEALVAAHELSYLTLPLLLRAAFLDVGAVRLGEGGLWPSTLATGWGCGTSGDPVSPRCVTRRSP